MKCSLAKLGPDGHDTSACEPLRVSADGKPLTLEEIIEMLAASDEAPSPDKPPVMPRVRAMLHNIASIIAKFLKRTGSQSGTRGAGL